MFIYSVGYLNIFCLQLSWNISLFINSGGKYDIYIFGQFNNNSNKKKLSNPWVQLDPTQLIWVGLNFSDPPWWVMLKNPLNSTQLDPCTPLICCDSESLRLILGEGFGVAIFEVDFFLVVWLELGGADQMVGWWWQIWGGLLPLWWIRWESVGVREKRLEREGEKNHFFKHWQWRASHHKVEWYYSSLVFLGYFEEIDVWLNCGCLIFFFNIKLVWLAWCECS